MFFSPNRILVTIEVRSVPSNQPFQPARLNKIPNPKMSFSIPCNYYHMNRKNAGRKPMTILSECPGEKRPRSEEPRRLI